MKAVALPDGTRVRACSIGDRNPDDPQRDFGLYLDPAWEPDWPAETIAWPDFGLPADSPAAARKIRDAFERARAGSIVEVGCTGGLGRTGTVLACFAVLAGLTAAEAVDWVRSGYDPAAIETEEQERWVRWFAAHLDEGENAR